MSKSKEQSIKEKLKYIAKKKKIAFNSLLETLFLERLMVRIANSKFKNNLIFKGGMCLSQYLEIGRETRDLDFLLHMLDSNQQKIREVFEEIASNNSADGIEFEVIDLNLLSVEHKKYPGYRLKILGKLGQVRLTVNVDVGIGDVVRPKLLEVELLHDNGPLFEPSIMLNAYPPEYIFAEKLEAIIYLGEANSRMKDFFDCYQIIQDETITKNNFKDAISETFSNRGTNINLVPEIADALTHRWAGFARVNRTDLELNQVIKEINRFLKGLGI